MLGKLPAIGQKIKGNKIHGDVIIATPAYLDPKYGLTMID